MNNIVKQAVSAALALSAASLIPLALAQSDKGAAAAAGAASSAPAQPGVPMGPTKAGPNAAVTGSTTAAGNSGAPAQSVPAAAGKAASSTGPTTSVAAKPLSSSDRSFMTKAAQAGAAEIETGKLAQANGANAEVKKFGEKMHQDHSKAGDELKALAQAKGLTLSDKPDRSHERMARQLKGLTGDKFDKVYAREAGVKDHKSVVALFTRQTQKGNDPDVKAFAQKTLPTLEEHLRMAQAMHDSVMAQAKR